MKAGRPSTLPAVRDAFTDGEWRSARWVANHAKVGIAATRKHLHTLTDQQVLTTAFRGGRTMWRLR